MMEHIFRNLNDIRVFDVMSEFTEESPVSIDDIMELLDLPFREQIQIEDSVKHLIEIQIIGIKYLPVESTTGCEICKYTDNRNFKRNIGHELHSPQITEIINLENYYTIKNDLTCMLCSAVMESSFMYAEKVEENDPNKQK